MKWNIYLTLRGPGGTIEDVPNNTNPVEASCMASVLRQLADNLPGNWELEIIGIRVVLVEETNDRPACSS